jgi:post-segregation antitoxin (ccd killing protein)
MGEKQAHEYDVVNSFGPNSMGYKDDDIMRYNRLADKEINGTKLDAKEELEFEASQKREIDKHIDNVEAETDQKLNEVITEQRDPGKKEDYELNEYEREIRDKERGINDENLVQLASIEDDYHYDRVEQANNEAKEANNDANQFVDDNGGFNDNISDELNTENMYTD